MSDTGMSDETQVADEDLEAAFGETPTEVEPAPSDLGKKRRFEPWHLPVKQFVRLRQWALQTDRLLGDLNKKEAVQVLRYFTLPGPDLLDVRVVAEACARRGASIELFGFDSAAPESRKNERGEALELDRVILRQAGRIVDSSTVIRGQLESIAIANSQEANQLQNRPPFHVINLDACNHLTYRRGGGGANLFDALRTLLTHQLTARTEWLLFITTRCGPGFLSEAQDEFQARIEENIRISTEFSEELASALETNVSGLLDRTQEVWDCHNSHFLKLYCVGLGKYLLKWFNAQVGTPAETRLVSAVAYRVSGEEPDMLAIAFRIRPLGRRVFEPGIDAVAVAPPEPEQAARVARKANGLVDADLLLQTNEEVLREAVQTTEALLHDANFDLEEWRQYVATHRRQDFVPDA